MLTDKELEEIRRKLLELEQEPPADGWKSIKAEIQPPDKNWRPVWWFGAMLLLLLTGIGSYFILDKKAETTEQRLTEVSATGEAAITEDLEQPVKDAAKYSSRVKAEKAKREKSTDKKDTESITEQSITEPTGEAPTKLERTTAAAQPVPTGSVSPKGRPYQKASVVSILIPTTPVDSATKAKPAVRTQELNTLAAAPDSAKATKAKPTADKATSTAIAAPDSIKQETKSVAFQSAAADSAATAIAPDSGNIDKKPAAKPKKQRATLSDPSGWAVGAYFAPRYAFRKFSPNPDDDILITRLSSGRQLDPERMGYEAGASISKEFKPKLTVEAGLSVVNLKENVNYTYTVGEVADSKMRQTPDGQIIVEATTVSEDRQLVSSYTYGGFRLGVNYYFLHTLRSRLNLSFAGGANLLLKGKTQEYRNGEWIETIVFPDKENLLEQSNYNLLVGVGYNVALHPKYEFTVMPALNYFLGSTFKEREPFGLRPYTLGVNLQVKRILGW